MNPPAPSPDQAEDFLLTSIHSWGWMEWALALILLLLIIFVLYIAVRMLIHRRRLHRMVGTMREDLLLRRELAAMAAGKDPKSQRREQFLRMETIRMDLDTARKSMAEQGINPKNTSAWLLLGEPGSGKSRLMESGGIEYPVGINDFSRASESTSTFNLWIAEKGTIWDIGGRLFLSRWGGRQDQEWQYFLEQWQHIYRSKLLSGVILTIPADALLLDSAELRDRKITLMAEEMRALSRISGAYCPVWIVITKSDQIDGFSEFFSLLSEQDCEQPLGWLNPRPGDPFDLATADLAFDHLTQHLKTLRSALALNAEIWEQTAAHQRRGDLVTPLYCLPESLSAIRDNLKRYLAGIFTHVQHTHHDRGLFQFQGFWLTATLDKPVTATERVIFEKKDGKLHPIHLPAQTAANLPAAPALADHPTESLVTESEKILSVASERHYFTRGLFEQLILNQPHQSDYTNAALRRIQRPYWALGLAMVALAGALSLSTTIQRPALSELVNRDTPYWSHCLDLFLDESISNAPILGVENQFQIPLTNEQVPHTKVSRREFIYMMTNMANVPAPLPLFWRPASWIVDHENSQQLFKTNKDFIDKATIVTMLLKPAVSTSRATLSYRADHAGDQPTLWKQTDTDCLATLLQITRYGILLMKGETVQDDINYGHLIHLEKHRGQDAAITSLWMNCFERNRTLGTMTILNGYLRPVSIEAAQAISKASALYCDAARSLHIYPSLHYQQMKNLLTELEQLRQLSQEMNSLEQDYAAAVQREDSASVHEIIQNWKSRYTDALQHAAAITAAEEELQLGQQNSLRHTADSIRDALSNALTRDLQRIHRVSPDLGDSQNADFLRRQLSQLESALTAALALLATEADTSLTDALCQFWDRAEGEDSTPRPWQHFIDRAEHLNELFSFPIPAGNSQETYLHRITRVQEARKQYDAAVQALGSTDKAGSLNQACWEQNWNILEKKVLLQWLAEAPHSNIEVLVPEPGAKVARKLPAMPYTPAAQTPINPMYDPIRANRRLTDLLLLSDHIHQQQSDDQADQDLASALQTLDDSCQHYLTDYVMYWIESIPSCYRISGIRNWAQFVESGDVMYAAEVGSILYELDDLIHDALSIPCLKDEARFPQLTVTRDMISKAQKDLDSETRRRFQTTADFISKLPLQPGKAWQSLISQPVEKLMSSYWASWYPAPLNSPFLWWNTYLQHGMRLLKQEATSALQDDLAACLAQAGKFPLSDSPHRSSTEILSDFDLNDLYDRLGTVAHLIDPQREEEIAKQAAARNIPLEAASLDLPIMGDHAAQLSKITSVLSLLADPETLLTATPILPSAETRATAITSGDSAKRLVPVGRRFPYCRILCNGKPITPRFNLNQQNTADIELLAEALPASTGELQFQFYRHSNADTPDSVLKLSSHWSALDLYLRPGSRLSSDKKTAYAPLIFRDREGYNCLFWFGMRFNRDMIPPTNWLGASSLTSSGDSPDTDLAQQERDLRKAIREIYLTNRNLPRKPSSEEIAHLRHQLEAFRQRGFNIAFQLVTPSSAERGEDARIRHAALYPYFSVDTPSINTGKLRTMPDTSQVTPYQLLGSESILVRLYLHTQDEFSSQYLDQRTALLDIVLNQASEYDPVNNYMVVPVSTSGGQSPSTCFLYLRPCLSTAQDDGLLPDAGAPTSMEYPYSELPDGDLPLD